MMQWLEEGVVMMEVAQGQPYRRTGCRIQQGC